MVLAFHTKFTFLTKQKNISDAKSNKICTLTTGIIVKINWANNISSVISAFFGLKFKKRMVGRLSNFLMHLALNTTDFFKIFFMPDSCGIKKANLAVT